MLCEQNGNTEEETALATSGPSKVQIEVEQCPVLNPTILYVYAQLDLDTLSNDIASQMWQSFVPQEHNSRINQCVKELEGIAQRIGPEWHVQPFGSTVNGFGTRESDVDVCCFMDGSQDEDSNAIWDLRHKLRPLIEQHQSFSILLEISRAKVPILKLRFRDQLEVDLSCHNTEPLPNTRLLKEYACLNPIVSQLGILIKTWAKREGVCGAPSKFLSSYSLILMTIYFLQVTMNLPCLNPAHFKTNPATDPIVAKEPSVKDPTAQLKEPLELLLCRFFYFYTSSFDWGTEVVSVRAGQRAPITDPLYHRMPERGAKRLHIEDPFLLSKNLNFPRSCSRTTF